MAHIVHWIQPTDPDSVQPLIDALNLADVALMEQIRRAARLQRRPFGVFIDYLNRAPVEMTPVQDPFTFDLDTDELIVFSEDPAVMIDALIEMGMYMQGFSTLMGVESTWKIGVAIGGWKHVRVSIRRKLGLPDNSDRTWVFMFVPEVAERYDMNSFTQLVTLAGCPNVEILFPPNAEPRLVQAYQHVSKIIARTAEDISIGDHAEFNARLLRAVDLIEERFAPPEEDAEADDH